MDVTLPNAVSITRVSNGWVVTPVRGMLEQYPKSDEIWVFDDLWGLYVFLSKINIQYPDSFKPWD